MDDPASPPSPPDDDLERWIAPAAAGEDLAWHALWKRLQPKLMQLLARPEFLGLRDRDEDRRNIAVEVMARLRADGHRRLGMYLAARRENPSLRFMTWLRIVTKRIGIDYLRGHAEYVDRRRDATASANGAWIALDPLPESSVMPGERPPVTAIQTARAMLAHADGALTEPQRRALARWLQGDSHDEIARDVGFADGAEAAKVVRAALERLRREFRGDGGGQ